MTAAPTETPAPTPTPGVEILGRRYHGRAIESSMDFAELLLADKQVAVVPGLAFEAEGFCRMSYATSLENINKGLDRIADFVGGLT